ncbi:MAG: biotin carboxylase [Magnetococcales bacterium]|nr:biotin carboxylase [Magnetococcales bacterium]
MTQETRRPLDSIDRIREYFAASPVPYRFISATNFNLMGLHEWVAHWLNVNLVDCYDGAHPQVRLVADDRSRDFTSLEEINRHLLEHGLAGEGSPQGEKSDAPAPQALFLFFDESIEEACRRMGVRIALPPNRLVREIDSKIVTTELGDQAGVPSVPNRLAKIGSFAELRRVAAQAGLGERWVVQTAYGDSGKTTFFIDNEVDYLKVARKLSAEAQVKVMRRVNCRGTAIEACATRWGTFVGPLLTELIGDPGLTPYPGGWCGNELYPEAFPAAIRQQAQEKTEALGRALYQRGYRGYFEVDYLIDRDTGELYLGELNPRITGISAMTNLSDFSARTVPLFLFHLLEYDDGVDLTLDVEAFNRAMLAQGAQGIAAQMILKHTEEPLQMITAAPVSGVYRMEANGGLKLERPGYDRRAALGADEAFILRILTAGEYAYKGADLAILFVNQVIGNDAGRLGPTGLKWLAGLKGLFGFRALDARERALLARVRTPSISKSGPAR